MTVQELYAEIGNYEEAQSRLMNDRFIAKFVMKFPLDPSFEQLMDAWKNNDRDAIFKAAHTMKGVCANLALSKLTGLASKITEAYRPGTEKPSEDMSDTVQKLQIQYAETIAAIRRYEGEAQQ